MKTTIFLIVISILIDRSSIVIASDIEDGVEDSSIDEYYEMGKIKNNISYITLNAVSRAYTSMNNDKIKQSEDGNSVVNGVVIGSGSTVQGDIIIIDQSEGNSTAISR